jgi:hypothetical protein
MAKEPKPRLSEDQIREILETPVPITEVGISIGRARGKDQTDLEIARRMYLAKLLQPIATSIRKKHKSISLAEVMNGALVSLSSPKYPDNSSYMGAFHQAQASIRNMVDKILYSSIQSFVLSAEDQGINLPQNQIAEDEDTPEVIESVVLQDLLNQSSETLQRCYQILGAAEEKNVDSD